MEPELDPALEPEATDKHANLRESAHQRTCSVDGLKRRRHAVRQVLYDSAW